MLYVVLFLSTHCTNTIAIVYFFLFVVVVCFLQALSSSLVNSCSNHAVYITAFSDGIKAVNNDDLLIVFMYVF